MRDLSLFREVSCAREEASFSNGHDVGNLSIISRKRYDRGITHCCREIEKEGRITLFLTLLSRQKELPIADEEAKHHIEVTRKNAVEQARPSSRHKPPVQSLFLEVPETRRQVPPVLPASQGAVVVSAESCRGLPPGRLSVDGADVKVWALRSACRKTVY